MEAHMREAAQRALDVLAVLLRDLPQADNSEFMWLLLGKDDEERMWAVSALLGITLGTIDLAVGDDGLLLIEQMADSLIEDQQSRKNGE